MKRAGRKKEWSVVIFGLGLLLLFPPILGIYDAQELVFGVSKSYLTLFGIWGIVILATALGAKRSLPDQPPANDENPEDQP